MYVIKDDSVVSIKQKEVIVFGKVQDPRIVKIETVVANYFNTTIHELNVFYRDTEAKVICCFLLHDLFLYSIGSIAIRYNINKGYLRNQITKKYADCLLSEQVMQEIISLREAYLNVYIDKPQEAVN